MIKLVKKYTIVLVGFLASFLFYYLHKVFFFDYLTNFTVEFLHLIFSISTIAILLILNIIYYKKPDNVGYSFMAITTFKMLILVVVFKKTIQTAPEILKPEKTTILLLFLIYLAVETILIARLLNKNQKK